MAFDFSTTIVNLNHFDMVDCVKLASAGKSLEYRLGRPFKGDILYDGKLITRFKELTVNDTIHFSVRRLVVGSQTFNICQIRINENKCCSKIVIEGADLYPAVRIRSSGVEINTAFSIGNTHGKEGMYIYFLNN